MNLKYLKFDQIDNESLIWEDGFEIRQNIQKYALYQGVQIFVRYENVKINNYWHTRKTSYSLDKKVWTEFLVDIQKSLKKMGK